MPVADTATSRFFLTAVMVDAPTDARVVRLSLVDKTQKHIASLNEQYKTIREFVFQEFDENELTEFTPKLATLKTRLEKACVRISLDF